MVGYVAHKESKISRQGMTNIELKEKDKNQRQETWFNCPLEII